MLKWKHSFQFAGYYAAIDQGYYREAGLEVELRVPPSGYASIPLVLSGAATYGVGSADLLLYRAQGMPIVVLAALFQRAPNVLMVRKDAGIEMLADLAGKRLMAQREDISLMVDSMLRSAGVDINAIQFLPHTRSVAAFVEGRVDAISGYQTNQPFDLDRLNVPYRQFFPADFGVDPYYDCLFTLEREVQRHPERVRALRQATLRGWAHALNHPEAIIDLILTQYDPDLSPEKLAFQVERMRELIAPDLVEIGYMYVGRWRALAETLTSLGLLTDLQLQSIDFERFVYNPSRNPRRERLLRMLGWILGLSVLIAGGAGLIGLRFRHLVKVRTAALASEKQNLASIFNAVPSLLVVADVDRRIQFVNSAFKRLTGYSDIELRNMTVESLHPAHCRERILSHFRKMLDREMTQTSLPLLCKDGAEIPVEIHVAHGFRDGRQVVFASMHDCRERLRMRKDVVLAAVMEKQNIAHELHDGVAQNLAAAAYMTHALRSATKASEKETVSEIQSLLQDSLDSIRNLARNLHASHVKADDFSTALWGLVKRICAIFDVDCRVDGLEKPFRLTDDFVATHLHFIVQESLMNAIRHGRARLIHIRFDIDDNKRAIRKIEIEDEGSGFNVKTADSDGLGLRILRYRADLIGACLQINSTPGSGTAVSCVLGQHNGLSDPTDTGVDCANPRKADLSLELVVETGTS